MCRQFSRQVGTWLRQSVTGLSPCKTGFGPRRLRERFLVDKVALGQVSLRVIAFSLVSIAAIFLTRLCFKDAI